MDPVRFAYRRSRGVEDSILILLILFYRFLKRGKTHAQFLQMGFTADIVRTNTGVSNNGFIPLSVTASQVSE